MAEIIVPVDDSEQLSALFGQMDGNVSKIHAFKFGNFLCKR